MSIGKAIAFACTLALAALVLTAAPAGARSTRELLGSFGPIEEPGGLAVDLETGNVYVADKKTDTVDVFGPTGGAPVDGVPKQITGLSIAGFDPVGIAVDNSCYEHAPRLTGVACEEYDPSYGDVYVMDNRSGQPNVQKFKLNSVHEYESAAGAVPRTHHGEANAIAVDCFGNTYISAELESLPLVEYKKILEKVTNDGKEELEEKLEENSMVSTLAPYGGYVAVDDVGDVYISAYEENGLANQHGVVKLHGIGGPEEVFVGRHVGVHRPVAVNGASGVVYVGEGTEIAEYNSAGVRELTFGSTDALGGSLSKEDNGADALAVNGDTERVYVANPARHDVDVFGGVVGPPVFEAQQPAVSSVARTSVVLGGTVNPESGEGGDYYFQYVPDAEYEPTAAEPYGAGGRTAVDSLAGGHVPETIERVVLTGLLPGTVYHYRMVVSNASATVYGPDETFTTAAATPPTVGTGPAGEVSATGVTLTGVVGPRGLPTSYVFEVGTDTSYGGAKLYGDAGSSTGEVPVSVGLQYLVPGTTYHYRLAATSFDGTSYGQDGTFTTSSVPSLVVQPSGTPLIVSPVVQFPSIAGAITQPVGAGKHRKAAVGARTVTKALRTCGKKRSAKRRKSCEAQARKRDKRVTKTDHSRKR
jgi:hypothetical protein